MLGFMSEETLKNIIRKTISQAQGSITYAYQGGEPTLRGLEFFKQAVLYQKQYNRRGIQIYNAFQTNGYLIDEKWCSFFRDYKFLIGLSVDGIQNTHDLFRHTQDGRPTYESVLRAAKLLEKYRVEYNILTVVNRKVAERVEEIYQNYQKNGWNYQQYIACLEPLGEVRGNKSYAISPREYGEFLIHLFNLWYRDYEKKQRPHIRRFENYIQILLGHQPESCEQLGCCGRQVVVEADGSVYPCDFYALDDYHIGNFNSDRLADIEKKRQEIGFIERSKHLSSKCRNCEFYFVCRGGCQRNRIYNEMQNGYENYFCESYRIFFSYSLEKMKKIADQIYEKRFN